MNDRTFDYPQLAKLVEGKTVHMICKKNYAVDPAGDLTVRFNDDTQPADIWATACYVPPGRPEVLKMAQLVFIVTPATDIVIQNGICKETTKPFTQDHASFPQSGTPSEAIAIQHWQELASVMPTFPLSGMVFLDLLIRCGASKIVIDGMNFYFEQTNLLVGRYRGMHALLEAIDWFSQIRKRHRDKIEWRSPTRLESIRDFWVRAIIRDLEERCSIYEDRFGDIPQI